MLRAFMTGLVLMLALPGAAQDLADLKGSRPLVVFADTVDDPKFKQQMALLKTQPEELEARRVVVLTDTDPTANGPLRQELRPQGFGLVLIDVDGSVAHRRPLPISVRELSNFIDRTPSRRQETGSQRP